MNAKKAKALRRECAGMPRMIQLTPLGAFFKWYRHRKTGETKRLRVVPDFSKTPVNHYRNAKRLYRGSVKAAVRAAARYSGVCEAIGKYVYPKRSII